MISGFINLYKPAGITSNRAMGVLKQSLIKNNIYTKVGYFGTLDPIAEGILPIALGRATRLFGYNSDKMKRYIAIFRFGISTDTLDISGKITGSEGKIPTTDEIEKVIPFLCGSVAQVPPAFSAKNVSGVRAYKLARAGKEFFLPPKKVEIYSIELTETPGENLFEFDIRCGGGVYIRSIARDMAELLNTLGIMTALKRVECGVFRAEDAVPLEKISEGNIRKYILNIDYFLKTFSKVTLSGEEIRLLSTGKPLETDLKKNLYAVYSDKNSAVGVGSVFDGKIRMKTWLL